MKILIVEDEEYERQFLEEVLRENPEISDLRSVADGRSFVETASAWNPDMVFLDIKIPEQNGLDALRELRNKGFRGEVVVLSAYDFFEYAQYAVTLDVSFYLLKPAGREEIAEAFRKTRHKIEEKALHKSGGRALRNFLASNREQTFKVVAEKGILHKGFTPENLEILEQIGFPRTRKILLLGILLMDCETTSRTGILKEQKHIQNLFPEEVMTIPWNSRILFILIPGTTKLSPEEAMLSLGGFLSKNHGAANVLYEEKPFSLEELPEILPEMEKELEDTVLLGRGMVSSRGALQREELGHIPSSFQDRQKYRFEQQHLLELFKNARDAQLESSLWSFFTEVAQNMGPPCANILVKGLLLSMLDYCFSMNCPGPTYTALGRQIFASSLWEGGHSENRLAILGILQELFEARQLLKDKNTALIAEVTDYVQKNIDSVNLESAARHINVSPQYLSRLFHNVSGKKFIDLVKEMRMEEAKKLLLQGDSVRNAAISVGYGNLSYFSFTFKNHTGLSPRDFARGRTTSPPFP